MTTFEKLQQKIKTDLGLVATDFKRTRAGIDMLGCGAFSWEAKTNGRTIGSGYTATELLKREKLETTERFNFSIEVI